MDTCMSPFTDTDSVIFEADLETLLGSTKSTGQFGQVDTERVPSPDHLQCVAEETYTPRIETVPNPQRDRRELRLLATERGQLPRLIKLMDSHRSFISRVDRTLIIRALHIYQRNTSLDMRPAIGALRASSRSTLEPAIRRSITVYLTDLMILFGATLNEETAPTDQERFSMLFEDNKLTQHAWRELLDMGIVWCNTVPSLQFVELVGTLSPDAFTSEVIARWGFENPSQYFRYSVETLA